MEDLKCQAKCIVLSFTRFQGRNHVSHGGTFDTSFDSREAIKVKITFERGFGDGLGEFDAARIKMKKECVHVANGDTSANKNDE